MATERILDDIIVHKRLELARHSGRMPKRRQRPLHSLRAALARRGTRLILEHKRASPSAGTLRRDASLQPVLDAYAGIADAFSVLTDEKYFHGSLDDLAYIASRSDVPVLRKDFILDPLQVREAHAYGADAVLLMLSVLDDAVYRDCAREAAWLGLDVLTEVHDETELARALALNARIIGLNNRSFADLSVDLTVTRRLAPLVPPDRITVCESGIGDNAALRALAPRVNAFLIGSALMRSPRMDLAARKLAFGEVKICGLTRADDAVGAWKAGAHWGGVVFAPGSPRRVGLEAARTIAKAAPLPLVGVFANAAPAEVGAVARALSLAAVQLHGDENAAHVAATRAALPGGCALWQAVRVTDAIPPLPSGADRLLFDCRTPGSGIRFDWSLLPSRDAMAAHGLAGGIHAGNIGAALATGAGLIDLSSGVERAPGSKSVARIAELFDAIRVATRNNGGISDARF